MIGIYSGGAWTTFDLTLLAGAPAGDPDRPGWVWPPMDEPGQPASVHEAIAQNDAPDPPSSRVEVHKVTPAVQPIRYVGLDMHKHYVMVGAVNKAQEVLLRPRKFTWPEFDRWCRQHIGPGDAGVIEASGNACHVYDQLTAQGASAFVANPLLVKWIGSAPVKTDPHDTLKLAKLLAADMLHTVWVPPAHVRALRTLVGQRQRWIRQRTQARNRLQGLLQNHNLLPPKDDLFAPEQGRFYGPVRCQQRVCLF